MRCRHELDHGLELFRGLCFEVLAMKSLLLGDHVGGVAHEQFLVYVTDTVFGDFPFMV